MQGSETGRTRRKSRNWTVTYGGYMVNGTVMKAHPSQEAAWTALRSPSNGGSERECLEPQSLYSILLLYWLVTGLEANKPTDFSLDGSAGAPARICFHANGVVHPAELRRDRRNGALREGQAQKATSDF